LEEYQKALRKRGEEDDTIGEKLQEAKLLLKKSKRKDLYALIGVAKGAAATEQEIKTAYRKAALKWHPDRHSASSEEKKKEAETKFKEINDAFELLTDPVKRRLYDQGYDREEIDQRADHEKNMGAHRSHGYGRRGYGGHYGDYEDFY
jgi:curved DNA-binding protein CbpA